MRSNQIKKLDMNKFFFKLQIKYKSNSIKLKSNKTEENMKFN